MENNTLIDEKINLEYYLQILDRIKTITITTVFILGLFLFCNIILDPILFIMILFWVLFGIILFYVYIDYRLEKIEEKLESDNIDNSFEKEMP